MGPTSAWLYSAVRSGVELREAPVNLPDSHPMIRQSAGGETAPARAKGEMRRQIFGRNRRRPASRPAPPAPA
jgi:hypothetical protein